MLFVLEYVSGKDGQEVMQDVTALQQQGTTADEDEPDPLVVDGILELLGIPSPPTNTAQPMFPTDGEHEAERDILMPHVPDKNVSVASVALLDQTVAILGDAIEHQLMQKDYAKRFPMLWSLLMPLIQQVQDRCLVCASCCDSLISIKAKEGSRPQASGFILRLLSCSLALQKQKIEETPPRRSPGDLSGTRTHLINTPGR